LTLEYSANLADEASIGQLCTSLAACLDAQRENDQRVFPLGGIRVRALRCEQYCIADGRPDAAFLHANLKIAAGRSDAAKRRPETHCSMRSNSTSRLSLKNTAWRCRWRSMNSAKQARGNTTICTHGLRPDT
jgi:hypothetical protein